MANKCVLLMATLMPIIAFGECTSLVESEGLIFEMIDSSKSEIRLIRTLGNYAYISLCGEERKLATGDELHNGVIAEIGNGYLILERDDETQKFSIDW